MDDVKMADTNEAPDQTKVTLEAEMKQEEQLANTAPETSVNNNAQTDNKIFSDKDIKSIEEAKNGLLNSIKDMIPLDLLRKENPTEEDKELMKQKIAEYVERQYLDRYYLSKLDLEKEYEKIKIKKSSLSRSQRDAVVGYFLIFKWGPVVQKKINELQEKTDRTPEEDDLLKDLLGASELKEAYDAVKKAENSDDKDVNSDTQSSTPVDEHEVTKNG